VRSCFLTVLDTDGTPKAGLRVYAFKGATYTNYAATGADGAERHRLITSFLNHELYPAHTLAVAYRSLQTEFIAVKYVSPNHR
jgi:hypothetical protein